MLLDNPASTQTWRYIDHSTIGLGLNALASFAYDDAFCTLIGQHNATPIVRTWVHRHTVVLGIQDSRLPFINEGRSYLDKEGYSVIVRNSGGLAVLLDEGILNISLIVKEEKGFSIDAGYEKMFHLIKQMFADFSADIQAYEIVGSYCPGSYDLSIDGKKFAGISQRRIRGGVAVQIYLCVAGDGSRRADKLRTFYELAVQGAPTKFTYPNIVPSTMASLSDLLHTPLTIANVMSRLLHTFQHAGIHLTTSPLTYEEDQLFRQQFERISERNEKFL